MEFSRPQALRVFNVLEIQLSGRYAVNNKPRDFLMGVGTEKYSIVNMGIWSWVKGQNIGHVESQLS